MTLGKKNRKLTYLALAFLLMFFAAVGTKAQSTGTITGTVSDPTNAAIPDATVTVNNVGTGQSRSVQTNASGVFLFPDLPIGSYTMQISKTGFETQKRSATELLTGQTIGIDVSLKVGTQVETVEVGTVTQQVQTSTSEVASTVDQQQMVDLPLNQRNPLQLTSLTPGAVLTSVGTESTQQDQTGLVVNGLRATENNFQLDGVTYENRFLDSVPILPNPDALHEFTIEAANFGAQYAGAGGLVQLSSKSGTNSLHGNAFEFIRNTALNARNWFNTVGTLKPPFKLNQFGGTVGGPIVIPHLYNGRDKTFFFFSAEDLQRRSSPQTANIWVPTAAEMSGDFSAFYPTLDSNGKTTCLAATSKLPLGTTVCKQIKNPITGAAYPNNKITDPVNSLSLAVAKQFTLGLTGVDPVSGGYTTLENQNIDSTQYLISIDHQVTAKNHFSGRYFYNQDNFQRPFAAPLGFFALNEYRNQNLALADTQTFSNTLTAMFHISAGRYARTQIPVAPGLKSLQDLGSKVALGTNVPIFPGIRDNIAGGFVNIFSGGALKQDPTSWEYRAEAVKVLGPHQLSFGFTFERDAVNANDYSYTPGDNTFDGSRSGIGMSDFYFGLDSQFYQDNGRKFYLRESRPALYLQDDYKVSHELTVNVGLRWDPWLPPIDKNQTLVGFQPGFKSTVAPNAPVGMQFVGDPGVSASIFRQNWKDVAPRLGFAYNIGGKGSTVIRGAYGIFYGFPEGLLYQRTDATQPIDLYFNLAAPGGANPGGTWDNIYANYPGGDPFPRAHVSPSQFSTYQFLLPVSGGVLNPNSHVEYTQAYNLMIDQKLPWGFSGTIGYVGNHAEHIMSSRQFNPAVCAPGAPCANLNNSTCSTCSSSGTNENARRLFPGLGQVELADAYEFAEFNSLQMTLTRRVSKGFEVMANLVYSKDMDNASSGTEGSAGPNNPFNLNAAYGPADFDQRIRANVSVNYVEKTIHAGNGFVKEIVNGYEVNAIYQAQSGLPFTVTSGTDRSLSGVGNDYADVVPNVNPTRPRGADFHKEWFNTAAFVPAAPGTFGNVHRNNLYGPGYEELDMSLFKNFFAEARVHGQFRAECFNLFNHPNFANPTSAVNSGNYGKITSTVSTSGTGTQGLPRVFQFGAKIIF
ncbi:MAG TPA: carboxypeptidase-like regulatory domain-containing protein [Acidobacteriaceae bacterium]|nr:carboxypeptidase-like regulatory domain-containing protein [Acidobacteriaceae bacterium]